MAARFWVLGLVLLSWLSVAAAEDFTGKVIGVADGDTVSVLRGRTLVKVRFNAIDCPEKWSTFRGKSERRDLGAGLRKIRVGYSPGYRPNCHSPIILSK